MVATVLIAAALAGYSIFVVVRKVQRRKNGCGGCCGWCKAASCPMSGRRCWRQAARSFFPNRRATA